MENLNQKTQVIQDGTLGTPWAGAATLALGRYAGSDGSNGEAGIISHHSTTFQTSYQISMNPNMVNGLTLNSHFTITYPSLNRHLPINSPSINHLS